MLIRTRMFFRKWLWFSRKPSTRSVAKRRRNRREAGFVQQAIYSGLGVEALESRQLLSATVLGTSAQAIGFNGVVGTGGGQTSPIAPAVTPGVTPTVPSLAGFGANSAPSASAPPTGSLNENSSLSFSTANSDAISITDAAAGTNADSLTLSVSQGTLTLASTTGLSFTAGANGSSSFTVSGTVTNVDSALDGLVYQPTTLYSGADSLAASVSDPTDSLSASTSVSITVAALNAPAISAPGSGSLSENGSLTFSSGNSNAISITDAAAGSNADSLTLSASDGTLTLASSNGLSFTNGTNGSSSFTVSGTVTNLNAALNGLVYQPTALYSGSDSLSVSVTDPGDTLSASTSVSLTVTALSAPAISVPGSPSLTGNGSLAFSGGNGQRAFFHRFRGRRRLALAVGFAGNDGSWLCDRVELYHRHQRLGHLHSVEPSRQCELGPQRGHLPGRCAVEFDQRVADRERSGSSGNHRTWHGARDREHLARLLERQQQRDFRYRRRGG